MAEREVDFLLIGGGLASANCAAELRKRGAEERQHRAEPDRQRQHAEHKTERQRKQAGSFRDDLGEELVERRDHHEPDVGVTRRLDAVEGRHIGAPGLVGKELLRKAAVSPCVDRLQKTW